jgi:hypothetical protein
MQRLKRLSCTSVYSHAHVAGVGFGPKYTVYKLISSKEIGVGCGNVSCCVVIVLVIVIKLIAYYNLIMNYMKIIQMFHNVKLVLRKFFPGLSCENGEISNRELAFGRLASLGFASCLKPSFRAVKYPYRTLM